MARAAKKKHAKSRPTPKSKAKPASKPKPASKLKPKPKPSRERAAAARGARPRVAPRAKPAAKPARLKSARKAAPKRISKPPAVAKSRLKPAPKRAAKPASKPTRKLARKRVAKPVARKTAKRTPVPPAFAAQRAGASPRELLLFELVRARAVVKASLQGLATGSTVRPVAPGKWSPLEIVLHLSERDRVRLDEFDRTLAGVPRSWASLTEADMVAVNEAHLGPLRAHTWHEAVRRLDALRDELLERLAAVPDLPADVWLKGHAFADMLWGLPEHDRHHAMQIKNARIGR